MNQGCGDELQAARKQQVHKRWWQWAELEFRVTHKTMCVHMEGSNSSSSDNNNNSGYKHREILKLQQHYIILSPQVVQCIINILAEMFHTSNMHYLCHIFSRHTLTKRQLFLIISDYCLKQESSKTKCLDFNDETI